MTRLLCLPLLLLLAVPLVGQDKAKRATLGTIERLDPAFDDLIPKDAALEKLDGGFNWVEGPVWVKKEGHLLFSDIPSNSVYKWKEGMKKAELFLRPSGFTGTGDHLMEPGSNGLLIDPEGRLVLMQHGDRRVARLDKDGKSFITLADRYGGKRLNSPNDGTFMTNGDLYFTDPPYGQMRKGKPWVFPDRELDFHGVFRLSKDGKLTLLTKEMTFPNGTALSPDEKTLYVANSDPKKAIWTKFPVNKDGTLGKGELFFDATKWVGTKKGLPDGMKVDAKGNVFATGPGGVLVFNPAGKLLGIIATGVNTGNCCFGEDGSVLYVMCDKEICRIKTRTKGLGF